ncbi:hypothetical protein [Paracoccus everestensis]|uniref:hypothetical protein n=1 Tax=Paracoccus everestensis TaxID=2903900 RepID=UPI001F464F2F|nr:hypothetical protein [Paracoccus everestensis]
MAFQTIATNFECFAVFRDDVLVRSGEGRALVKEYYRDAPRRVPLAKLNGEQDNVWREIQSTIDHIEQGDYLAAIAAYRFIFERLRGMAD